MTSTEVAWAVSRIWIGALTRVLVPLRQYGIENVPTEGGVVLASNHLSWIDIPVLGVLSPRRINFVAKSEAHEVPLLGWYIRLNGTLAVRRGESDREAVRQMREAARTGSALGLFVEGTRQRSGRPGKVQPGAAMVALQEEVPVVPIAVYGTQFWRPGNFAPCSVAWGRPMHFDGLPKNARGYREASAKIERAIHTLFDWLAEVHAKGRPRGLTPPL